MGSVMICAEAPPLLLKRRKVRRKRFVFIEIGIDTLCGYVWPIESDNPNTIKTQRQGARKAINKIQGLGWSVTNISKENGKFPDPKP